MGASESNAGDDFHFWWAAHRALRLVEPGTRLWVVALEGPARVDDPDESYETVDVAEYFGGDRFATAESVVLSQLKYSTRHPGREWTVARICEKRDRKKRPDDAPDLDRSVISDLAEAYRKVLDDHDPKGARKVRVALVSNRPASPLLVASVAEAAEVVRSRVGRRTVLADLRRELRSEHAEIVDKLATAVGARLGSTAFCGFVAALDLSETGTLDRAAFARAVRVGAIALTPGKGSDSALRLFELVRQEALPGRGRGGLNAADVLAELAAPDLVDLYPAPPRLAEVHKMLPVPAARALANFVMDHPGRLVIASGPAGTGKTTTLRQVEEHLPAGSVVVLFDCYGAGDYLNAGEERHTLRRFVTQVINELALRCGTSPLVQAPSSEPELWRLLTRTLEGAGRTLAPDGVLVLAVDAADNAVFAAEQRGDRGFVADLVTLSLPQRVAVVLTTRSHRLTSLRTGAAVYVELPLFKPVTSAAHLRQYRPGASDDDAASFHERTAGNPRAQYNALAWADENGADMASLLDKCAGTPEAVFTDPVDSTLKVGQDDAGEQQRLALMLALARPARADLRVSARDVDIAAVRRFTEGPTLGARTLGVTGPPRDDSILTAAPIFGAVRIIDADPRHLGVHPSIRIANLTDNNLPFYIERDVDSEEDGLRSRLASAMKRGGFVLLVGGSSAGKTRSAYEALSALMPSWWLVHPTGIDQLAALAAHKPARTVIWLDEIQHYLSEANGLGGIARTLLSTPNPAVIIGSLWPERYTTYILRPLADEPDQFAREREFLNLADVVHIGSTLTPSELGRAREATAADPRLRIALGDSKYGLTQILAAAPQLVDHWTSAEAGHPYGWALLTAAIDLIRLGVHTPISLDFLKAAAPGYCSDQQRAEAGPDWFDQAFAYATRVLRGATAALLPVAGAGMGDIRGYTVADYLLQYAAHRRRAVPVPSSAWDAALAHVRGAADVHRLAVHAERRLLYRYAIPFYRRAGATETAADLLATSEYMEALRAQAGDGDWDARKKLATQLARRGHRQELRLRADQGDLVAAEKLADLLAERGDLRELTERADMGDGWSAKRLSMLLSRRGDLDSVRARADNGDGDASRWLAYLLTDRGDLEELRSRADRGDGNAAFRLADLLAARCHVDELRTRATQGDLHASKRLAYFYAHNGDLEAHRRGAAEDDKHAASRLVDLLAARGHVGELRTRAAQGDRYASQRLADLSTGTDSMDAARIGPDTRDPLAAMALNNRLAKRCDLEGLQVRIDSGDIHATIPYTLLLVDRGDLDLLRARADVDLFATSHLINVLEDRGNTDEIWSRADTDTHVAQRLAYLLSYRNDLQGLEQRANRGDFIAAERLASVLAARGDLQGLHSRADRGDGAAAAELARVLADCGDLIAAEEALRMSINLGHRNSALMQLSGILHRLDEPDEAGNLARFGLNPDGITAEDLKTKQAQ